MTKRVEAAAGFEWAAVVVAATVSCVAGVQPAWGQDREDVTVDLGECVDLESAEERFACYEARVDAALEERRAARPTAAPGGTADASPAPAATTQVEVRASERVAASQSRSTNERAGGEGEDAEEFFGTVAELQETVPNSYLITLDNGQVWRQNRPKRYLLRPGQRVRIYPTPWGSSFRLTAEDVNGYIQVERVR
jgi:hypothetical protein